MDLITPEIRDQLLANWRKGDMGDGNFDPEPVVKFFTPSAGATWLITEMVEHDPDTLYGLCDLGLGEPELGYVTLSELQSLKGPLGLGVERDLHFQPAYTIGEYARRARDAQGIAGI